MAFQEGVLSKHWKRDEDKGIMNRYESEDVTLFLDEQGKELKRPAAWEKFQKEVIPFTLRNMLTYAPPWIYGGRAVLSSL